jgi:hypothetical protein
VKTDEVVTIAALGAAAYLVYKLSKPLSETVGGVGQGITTAVQGVGQGVSDIGEGVSAPFGVVAAKAKTLKTREELKQDIYSTSPSIRFAIEEGATYAEQTATSAAQSKKLKQQASTSIQAFNTATTEKALVNLTPETVQRKTEYGTTVGQFLEKTFMPTASVAQERRDTAATAVKSIVNTVSSSASKALTAAKNTASSAVKAATSTVGKLASSVTSLLSKATSSKKLKA